MWHSVSLTSSLSVSTWTLALTRDLFLFACYTGTAYADTVSITEENLFRDEEGSLWLRLFPRHIPLRQGWKSLGSYLRQLS